MREKHFMIDIETTGIDPSCEDLLQIGILEMDFIDGFWKPGKSFEILQRSTRTPQSEFAKIHMVELYKRCNEATWTPVESIRQMMLSFFRSCGALPPDVYLAGWNTTTFDIPFLLSHRYLNPSKYVQLASGKEERVGDFHYRVFELSGAIALAQCVFPSIERNNLCTMAQICCPDTLMLMPPGKEHDALYDCYKQVKVLNGLIHLVRKK